jgi:hypothetical protein
MKPHMHKQHMKDSYKALCSLKEHHIFGVCVPCSQYSEIGVLNEAFLRKAVSKDGG